MSKIKASYREPEGIDNWNVVPPRTTSVLEVEELERRRKNYEAIRAMLLVLTGSDQWEAYTYRELLQGAQNALSAEVPRIK